MKRTSKIRKAKDDDKEIFDLKDLKLKEVSLVDEGANPGAAIMLFKRRDKTEFIKALKERLNKDAAVFDEIEENSEAMNALWSMFNSFQDSMHSILNDDDIADKQSMVLESLGQFNEALSNALTKGGHNMATKKAAKKIGKAEHEPDATEKTEHEEELAALKAEHEDALAALKTEHEEELKANKAEHEADPEEDDAEKEMDETTKALNKKMDNLAKQNDDLLAKLAKSDERVEVAKFEKMADAYEFVPVEKQKLGALLRSVSKAGDDDVFDTLEKVLTASAAAQGVLTKMTGTPLSNAGGTAHTAFYAKAKEYQDSEGVSKQKGVALAKAKHPEMWTEMRKETN